jgi:hypothetical protein
VRPKPRNEDDRLAASKHRARSRRSGCTPAAIAPSWRVDGGVWHSLG